MKKKVTQNKIILEMHVDKPVVSREKACTRILEINITPPENDFRKERAPLNLSLVVDRSGSMEGEKLHYVKQAAAHVVDLLDEKDRTSIVIYDDVVETIFPAEKMTRENKAKAKSHLLEVKSGSMTFLSGGWLKGCEQVAEGIIDGTINRTLLLTDGLANRGITDIEELSFHTRALYVRGVTTSCFGVGEGYDEHLLEAMSNSGGGNFHFLETLNAIPLVFEREFKDLINISLRDTECKVQLPAGVSAEVSAGYHTETVKDRLTIALGSLYSGKKQSIYLKLHFEKGIKASQVSLPMVVRGKGDGAHKYEEKSSFSFQVVSESEEVKAKEDKSLLERFAQVDMADKANEALKLERAGDRKGAARVVSNSLYQHAPHISPKMSSKYEMLSDKMGLGMSEVDRKRHHREEYDAKRGRATERDYQVTLVNGHLIARIEDMSVLIDTGIPISLGSKTEWYFLNEVHQLSQDYMRVTLAYLSQMVGTQIDIMLGADILKKYHVTIDLPANRLGFSSFPLIHSEHRIKMDTFIGAPSAPFGVNGSNYQMFVDTGAKLSYVNKSIAANYTSVGTERDFYPGMGEFETSVYDIPMQLGQLKFNLRCGVLPTLLETTLNLTGNYGIIGSELYQKFVVDLAFPEGAIFLKEPL